MNDKYKVLKQFFGYTSFRIGQENIVDCLLSGGDVLAVMPTGAGKSICYQVPAIMMTGITIVVSPLISLMKDQVNSLIQQGVSAAYINRSLTSEQYSRVLRCAYQGKYKIIYVAPERLLTRGFLNFCKSIKISLLAVDEAHCVSQWGQDFRPSYLNISEFIESLPSRPVVGAFTATATNEVKNDIIEFLKLKNPMLVTTGFDRPNLYFAVSQPKNKKKELIHLIKKRNEKSGIVYCSTRNTVEEVCELLNTEGFSATRYHAGLSDSERIINQDDFVYDRKKIMVATNAFGMGIDKSNVAYVIHYNMPKNIENYYQEAGRAGRDGAEAECILLYGKSDVRTNQFFIEKIEPNPQLSKEQNELIRKKEEERLKYMTFYCTTSDCLRRRILKYFGEDYNGDCGKCSNCLTEFETVDVTVEAQKILSCIIRAGERYGEKMICDVLRGKLNERIKNAGLNKLSTYGIMNGISETEIKYIISKLEEQGYIIFIGKEYPIIKVTDASRPILRGNASVKIKKSLALKSRAESPDTENVNPELLNALKELRTKFARKRGVPAYVIFTDAAIIEMCRKLPATDEEFLSINGVGYNKLEKYGEVFLETISKFRLLNND